MLLADDVACHRRKGPCNVFNHDVAQHGQRCDIFAVLEANVDGWFGLGLLPRVGLDPPELQPPHGDAFDERWRRGLALDLERPRARPGVVAHHAVLEQDVCGSRTLSADVLRELKKAKM